MSTPLAHLIRPQNLNEFIGQNSILGSHSLLRSLILGRRLSNLILWGPPGTGKTTLANLLSQEFEAPFIALNAIEIGAKNLREIGDSSRLRLQLEGRQTLVFIDEIHRLNKAQQDVLLPFIEKGEFVLIGATTENPSYELNRAVLSRCHLLIFERLEPEHLMQVWKRANQFLSLNDNWIDTKALDYLIQLGDGDARRFINLIEVLSLYWLEKSKAQNNKTLQLTIEIIKEVAPKHLLSYDKNNEAHYDLISAFIKSIRGSDPDAGLYYLARMLEGGEDPMFIARRLVILASEDVGNADPRGLQLAVAGAEAVKLVGLPEGAINLAQVVTYLSSAPKSNRSYLAWNKAKDFVNQTKSLPVPLHLRSSRRIEMKKLGYGLDYKYPHDEVKGWVEQNYFPENVNLESFYEPSERGFEKNIKDYRNWLKSKS